MPKLFNFSPTREGRAGLFAPIAAALDSRDDRYDAQAVQAEGVRRFREIDTPQARRLADMMEHNPRALAEIAERYGGMGQLESSLKAERARKRANEFIQGAGGAPGDAQGGEQAGFPSAAGLLGATGIEGLDWAKGIHGMGIADRKADTDDAEAATAARRVGVAARRAQIAQQEADTRAAALPIREAQVAAQMYGHTSRAGTAAEQLKAKKAYQDSQLKLTREQLKARKEFQMNTHALASDRLKFRKDVEDRTIKEYNDKTQRGQAVAEGYKLYMQNLEPGEPPTPEGFMAFAAQGGLPLTETIKMLQAMNDTENMRSQRMQAEASRVKAAAAGKAGGAKPLSPPQRSADHRTKSYRKKFWGELERTPEFDREAFVNIVTRAESGFIENIDTLIDGNTSEERLAAYWLRGSKMTNADDDIEELDKLWDYLGPDGQMAVAEAREARAAREQAALDEPQGAETPQEMPPDGVPAEVGAIYTGPNGSLWRATGPDDFEPVE